jgi:hypothetical protein
MSAPGWQPPVYPTPPEQPALSTLPPTRSFSSRLNSSARRTLAVAAVSTCVFAAGLAGVVVGTHLGFRPVPPAAPSRAATTGKPSPDEVREQTVDLCTRFAAAYAAMPDSQNTGYDVLPTINYIADALRDNPVAAPEIRATMAEETRLMREHAAALSRELQRGAVQPPSLPWSAGALRETSERTWNLCQGYGT